MEKDKIEGQPQNRRLFSPFIFWIGIFLVSLLIPQIISFFNPASVEIDYSAFKTALSAGKIDKRRGK